MRQSLLVAMNECEHFLGATKPRLPSSRPRQWQEESRVGLPGDWLPRPGSNILHRIFSLWIQTIGAGQEGQGGTLGVGREQEKEGKR